MAANLAEKAWYIVTTYSMHESKTAENLRKRIGTMNMEEEILRVLVAEQPEQVLDKKTGLPVEGKFKMKNLFPGYIFVEMKMTDQSWYIVRNTPGVTGIAGSSGGGQKPTPIPNEQMEAILKRMNLVDESMYARYNVGSKVKIIHGPFEGTEGEIESIDQATGACRIQTMFFGRVTPIDLDFSEIEIIK